MTAQERPRPLSIAIAALGGQGGGVLSNWIVDLAGHAGYLAQYTSVPGVAQRTGATIYYIEIFPKDKVTGPEPVFALTPVPGDVDIVIAAEWMEAGRAIQRGFVTPDLTTLIASTHRVYAISEKSAMGQGMTDAAHVQEAAQTSARCLVHFDMMQAAQATGSVISAILLGALAGVHALPFDKTLFEETITRSGIAVESNLAGFRQGYRLARARLEQTTKTNARSAPPADHGAAPGRHRLCQKVDQIFPEPCREVITAGLERCLDYQDTAYGASYLEILQDILALDDAGQGHRLTRETGRHLALWMSYEDTIRVADIKIRRKRFDHIRMETAATASHVVHVVDYVHPRVEEICDTLPAPLGRALVNAPRLKKWLGRRLKKGRRIHTSKLSGFLLFYMIAALRRWRRRTYRYAVEQARIASWLERIKKTATRDYDLAVEIAACQNLVKGYGDTHARGLKNFSLIMDALDAAAPEKENAALVRVLRDAALADDAGTTLQSELDRLKCA